MVYKIHQFYLSFKWVYYLNMSTEHNNDALKEYLDSVNRGYRDRILPNEIKFSGVDISNATYIPTKRYGDGEDEPYFTLPSILLLETTDGRTFKLTQPHVNLPNDPSGAVDQNVTREFRGWQIESVGIIPDKELLALRFQEKWTGSSREIKSSTIDIYHSRRKNTRDNTQ